MSTILVPTTFSHADSNAFRYAVQVAMRYNWSLRLAHVSPIVFGMTETPIFLPKDDCEKALDHFVQSIPFTHDESVFLQRVGYQRVALDGTPVSGLLDYAEREKVRLIVAAGSQKSGFEHLFFGSVSADLVRLADCPVLLVPESSVFRGFESIVFGSDMRAMQPAFLDRVLALARQFHSFVHFLHIGDDVIDDMEIKQQLFDKLFKKGEPEFGFAFSYLEDSDIENGLTAWLLENPTQLLILSTRHRGFFESIGHHSVTAEMARKPIVPILVLHEEDPQPASEFITQKGMTPAAA